MTTGPWRPIAIDSYTSRISDLQCAIQVNEDLSAQATINFFVEGQKDGISAIYRIFEASSRRKELTSGNVTLSSGRGSASFRCKSGEVKLWYPVGYGSQSLYEIEVVITESKQVSKERRFCFKLVSDCEQGGKLLCKGRKKIGFRRVRVVQDTFKEENEPGHSFVFEINNIRIFCGGSNWIPGHNFLTE